MSISVVVADDQPLMRAALRMCLSAEDDVDVVAEAGDGAEAVQLARTLRPDVVIMDIRMPKVDGVAATSLLTAADSGTGCKVLVVTTFDLDEYVVEALRAGASGFLLKDATPEELVNAVRVIAAGNALLAPSVTRRLLDRYARALPTPNGRHSALLARLTQRELAVLEALARGRSNAQIAASLHLAESSVKSHVAHLLTKLEAHTRVHLVIFAYESGLVQRGTI